MATTLIPIADGRGGFLRVLEHGGRVGVDLWATGHELSPAGQAACWRVADRYAARRRDGRPGSVAVGLGPTWVYVERVASADRRDCLDALVLAILDDLAAAA